MTTDSFFALTCTAFMGLLLGGSLAFSGYRLFTFLDHDRVPWHNNNAEHAIHAFARYRRFADGRFTRKSVSIHLAILTVFQTCEYRGASVLDFLLSGQTSLDQNIRHR